MRSSTLLSLVAASLLLPACAMQSERVPEDPEAPLGSLPPGDVVAPPDVIDPPVLAPADALEACLSGGGSLAEIDRVDNNDRADHGAIVAFAVSPDQRLAAAGADGTVKLWTLEGFVGEIASAVLTYGPEVPVAPAADLDFHDGRVVVADTRGLVTSWTVEGEMDVLGGTDPEISMSAVAFDEPRTRFAHADVRTHGGVMVRSLDGTVTVFGPLPTTLDTVGDLAFLPDGHLVVAGRDAEGAAIELRDAADPMRTSATARAAAGDTEIAEIAAAGTTIVAALGDTLLVLDATLHEQHRVARGATNDRLQTVALTSDGRFALVADARGSVSVVDTVRGIEQTRLETHAASAVAIRVPTGSEVAFVAHSDGTIRALACRP